MSASATLFHTAYGDVVAEDVPAAWPAAGQSLLHELTVSRDLVALVAAGAPDTDQVVARLQSDLGLSVVYLGTALADRPHPPSLADVERACGEARVLADIDLLMWPEMHIAPMQFIRERGRRRPTIGVWPGAVNAGRATYSAPGRPDYQDVVLRDVLVLQPSTTRFPDEVPFTIERILP